jgi:hypothetical protein
MVISKGWWGVSYFPTFIYIYYIYILEYGTAGFLPPPVFQKPYFEILFFFTKDRKVGNRV